MNDYLKHKLHESKQQFDNRLRVMRQYNEPLSAQQEAWTAFLAKMRPYAGRITELEKRTSKVLFEDDRTEQEFKELMTRKRAS